VNWISEAPEQLCVRLADVTSYVYMAILKPWSEHQTINPDTKQLVLLTDICPQDTAETIPINNHTKIKLASYHVVVSMTAVSTCSNGSLL
jgi:hypothetical protein